MERKPFEVEINGEPYTLELGKCAIIMFRLQQHLDYLAVHNEEDELRRFYNSPDLFHWMAGYMIKEAEDGELFRPTTYWSKDDMELTFREMYGWNPVAIERDEPSPTEQDAYLKASIQNIEQEWEGMKE